MPIGREIALIFFKASWHNAGLPREASLPDKADLHALGAMHGWASEAICTL